MTTGVPVVPNPQTPGPSGDRGIGGVPTGGMNTAQQSAWTVLEQMLQSFGFSGKTLNEIMSWAKGQIVAGYSETQISLDFYQTPWFKDQFPGIFIRQQNGLPAITPAQYVSTVDSYMQVLHEAGIPKGLYDTPQAIGQLIGSDVSPSELQDRIQNVYDVVNTAPPEVKQAFASYYGVNGASALASYVMNPKAAETVLAQQAASAQIGGAGAQYGFGVGRTQALDLAQQGVTYSTAQTGFKQAAVQDESLIHGGINETNPLGEQGVIAGEFGENPGAAFLLAQGIAGKQAAFQGSGSALQTGTGITGLGKAQSI